MTLLAAIAVTARVLLILLALAMLTGWWPQVAKVVLLRPGWQAHLSSTIVAWIATGCAIGSAANIFIDAGRPIDEQQRLFIQDIGLLMVVSGLLTSAYRRALRSGPRNARRALLSGTALLIPALGFIALLTLGGANG